MDGPGLDSFASDANELLLNPRAPEDVREQCQRIVSTVGPGRGHFWLLTSGSTGTSKLVALAKSAALVSAEAVNRHLETTPADVWCLALPTFHVGGLGILARSYLSGNRIVTLPKWEPESFVKLLNEERVTLTSLVPTQLDDLVRGHRSPPPSLRAAIIGGAVLSPVLYRSARRRGWPVLPSFGMTETASQIATATLRTLSPVSPPPPTPPPACGGRGVISSVSAPLPPQAGGGVGGGGLLQPITVLSHATVGINDEGLLTVASDALFTGYATWDEDKPHFRDPKVNGVFTTEDYARLERDADGNTALVPLGRKGRVVKVKGELVSLAEVERKALIALRAFPAVQDVAVVAIPHERDGSRLVLYLESPALTDSQIARLREILATALFPFEKPAEIYALPAFPRSELGKVQFARLQPPTP